MKRRSRAVGGPAKPQRPTAAKVKRPTVSDEAARPTSSIASKQGEINRLSRELNEAQEQQSATSEVLRVISSSRGDLEPVFGTMLEHAVRICDATFGIIYRWDGELLHLLAVHNAPAALVDARRRSALRPSSLIRHMVETRTTAHVADVAAHKDYIERHPGAVAAVELGGTRTYLAVPMLKENELIGALSLSRQVVRPFTDKQIELVKNFAAQAVIAIENARLLNELRQRTVDLTEALGQQTATADVLQVISSSPGDLEAVFATMLDKAVSICNATFGELYRWNGETFQLASMHNTPPQFIEERQSAQPIRPNTNTITGRLVATKSTAQIVDLAADPSYIDRSRPSYVAAVELGGVRTVLAVPMIKDDALIGMITLCRQEVRAFTERQIVLVENFAAQAVIAIENARLLNELRQRTTDLTEALEQQTAASQVLQVISSSPGELQPVFQAMLENATRICEAKFGVLFRYDDAGFEPAALSNAPPAYANFVWSRGQFFPQTGNGLDRLRRAQTVIHSVDEAAEPVPTNSARLAGARSQVLVPMLKEGKLAGAIAIYRQEVRPFTDKQIELVKNFAAQAVIAIENARLLNELKQSLEEQTATAEVLSVISSSPGKLEPVFQAMLENAVRICDAKFGNIYRWDGDALHLAASHNTPTAYAEQRRRLPLRFNQMPESLRRMIATMAPIQVDDIRTLLDNVEPRNPVVVAGAELGGIRTVLNVPMVKENNLVGAFIVSRQEVRPFTDKQIELVQNFAAQAVIAIENARLLNELRQSLEQQTATSKALQVISSATFDLQTVLDTLVESAVGLCEADGGAIWRPDGGMLRAVANFGASREWQVFAKQNPITPDRGTVSGRVFLEGKVVHIQDVQADSEFTGLEYYSRGDYRSSLGVPLSSKGETIGVFVLARSEVREFTDKQIELVTTFADQAVIAIENTRLLTELRERTDQLEMQSQKLADLNQRLEQRVADQVGEIERMSRLRRFLPPQVADLIVASGAEKQLESHRREITALFCDLRGFTGFTESADAEDVMALLRDYHAAIGEIIIKYNGTLERYAGDGVMVVFNDPVPVENPALQAVLMALEVRDAIGALTETWRRLGHEIGFGIGIAHGFATLGTIGFEGRFDYAAIGTVSNVASRLCDEAKPGQILISPRVLMKVENAVKVEPVGEFELKGIRRPLAAYNVVAALASKI